MVLDFENHGEEPRCHNRISITSNQGYMNMNVDARYEF